jgi:hypothetical protein
MLFAKNFSSALLRRSVQLRLYGSVPFRAQLSGLSFRHRKFQLKMKWLLVIVLLYILVNVHSKQLTLHKFDEEQAEKYGSRCIGII